MQRVDCDGNGRVVELCLRVGGVLRPTQHFFVQRCTVHPPSHVTRNDAAVAQTDVALAFRVVPADSGGAAALGARDARARCFAARKSRPHTDTLNARRGTPHAGAKPVIWSSYARWLVEALYAKHAGRGATNAIGVGMGDQLMTYVSGGLTRAAFARMWKEEQGEVPPETILQLFGQLVDGNGMLSLSAFYLLLMSSANELADPDKVGSYAKSKILAKGHHHKGRHKKPPPPPARAKAALAAKKKATGRPKSLSLSERLAAAKQEGWPW